MREPISTPNGRSLRMMRRENDDSIGSRSADTYATGGGAHWGLQTHNRPWLSPIVGRDQDRLPMTSTMQHQKAGKTLITLWYAKHRNIPVEGIEVALERGTSQGRAGIYRLSTKLTITGALSAAQPDDLPRAAQNNQSYGLLLGGPPAAKYTGQRRLSASLSTTRGVRRNSVPVY